MNLYVSNLSYNIGEAELNELFSSYGAITSVKIIMDRETGRSRGFGFVEMSTTEDGQKAVNGLNNTELDGRQLSVSEAREKTERKSNGFSSGGGRSYSKW